MSFSASASAGWTVAISSVVSASGPMASESPPRAACTPSGMATTLLRWRRSRSACMRDGPVAAGLVFERGGLVRMDLVEMDGEDWVHPGKAKDLLDRRFRRQKVQAAVRTQCLHRRDRSPRPLLSRNPTRDRSSATRARQPSVACRIASLNCTASMASIAVRDDVEQKVAPAVFCFELHGIPFHRSTWRNAGRDRFAFSKQRSSDREDTS